MSYSSLVYKIFIASPSDLISERNIVREVIHEWNAINSEKYSIVLLPIGWETHTFPEMGNTPQDIINKRVLSNCDILVGLFWTRVGSPTMSYESGTIEEIEEHIKTEKPAMIYFSSQSVTPESLDHFQFQKLNSFRESCKSRGLYKSFDSQIDFKSMFKDNLQLMINTHEMFSSKQEQVVNISFPSKTNSNSNLLNNLSTEAKSLLIEGASDPSGYITAIPFIGGIDLRANGKHFIDDQMNARDIAKWRSALNELEFNDLIEATNVGKTMFRVTLSGYNFVEKIGKGT